MSADELLRIDAVCDRFEADLRAGRAGAVEAYLPPPGDPIRERLAEELRRVVADDPPPPASRLDEFERLEQLGVGSFGTVWRARDRALGRDVALKIAHADSILDPDKFLREARATAQLNHPYIVRVFEAGQAGGRLFIVREYVAGRSLAEAL